MCSRRLGAAAASILSQNLKLQEFFTKRQIKRERQRVRMIMRDRQRKRKRETEIDRQRERKRV